MLPVLFAFFPPGEGVLAVDAPFFCFVRFGELSSSSGTSSDRIEASSSSLSAAFSPPGVKSSSIISSTSSSPMSSSSSSTTRFRLVVDRELDLLEGVEGFCDFAEAAFGEREEKDAASADDGTLGEGNGSWDLLFAGLGVSGVLIFVLEVGDLRGDSGWGK